MTVQQPDLNRLVLLQHESVIQLNLAKPLTDFPALSEVSQLSPDSNQYFCLPDFLNLTRQAEWDYWLDMINTFYHVGRKQVCEYQACFSPIDQKPIARISIDCEDED